MERLRNRIVLVTGAAGGIGAAVAAAVGAAGGVAIPADLERAPGIDHRLDVTREADWRTVLHRIASDHGRLDGLVNAAAGAPTGTLEETALAVWRGAIDASVLGPFLGLKAAWALLGVGGGSVVNVAATGRHDGVAGPATQGAVRQLTRAAALDGARQPKRIRVNAVHVLSGDAPLVGGMPARGPEGAAAWVLYLLSDQSAFVTGASYEVDGGLRSAQSGLSR